LNYPSQKPGMEDFINHLRQDPKLFYFVIIFASLWGMGVLWGVVFVIISLSKRSQSVACLKSLGFKKTDNDKRLMQAVSNIAIKTLWENFSDGMGSSQRDKQVTISINRSRISISYSIPPSDQQTLPRATGLKEMIQLTERKMTLHHIRFRDMDGKAFYAQTDDTKTIRAYQPKTRKESTVGWALCFACATNSASSVCIYKKFTGHRKLLVDMAFRIAQIRPLRREGLIPEFAEEFEIMSASTSNAEPLLDNRIQSLLLKYKRHIPEGLKIFINKEGLWMTGEEWLSKSQMKNIVKLCDELTCNSKRYREPGIH